jgi:hypothetical protein
MEKPGSRQSRMNNLKQADQSFCDNASRTVSGLWMSAGMHCGHTHRYLPWKVSWINGASSEDRLH